LIFKLGNFFIVENLKREEKRNRTITDDQDPFSIAEQEFVKVQQ